MEAMETKYRLNRKARTSQSLQLQDGYENASWLKYFVEERFYILDLHRNSTAAWHYGDRWLRKSDLGDWKANTSDVWISEQPLKGTILNHFTNTFVLKEKMKESYI